MSRKGIIILTIILFVAIGGFILMMQNGDDTDQQSNTQTDTSHNENTHQMEQPTNTAEVDLTGQSVISVDIRDYAFSQPIIKIRKGAKVIWTNFDSVQHNVMGHHEGDEESHTAPTADEVKPDVFAGPLLSQGQTYSFTFNEAGTFPYHCAPHPYMTGTVTVAE